MDILKAVLLIALLLLGRVSAAACSCIEPPPPAEKLQKASAVFVGRVISKSEKISRRVFTFAVQEVFKGDLKAKAFVSSTKDGASCGVDFSEDKIYLIYAHGTVDDLRTNICAANQDAGSPVGKNEIQALRSLSQPLNP